MGAQHGGGLRATQIIAHFDPLMWVIENPATGLLKTARSWSADLLQVRNSVQEADAAVDQHALEAEAKPVQARQPLQGVAGRQAPPGKLHNLQLGKLPSTRHAAGKGADDTHEKQLLGADCLNEEE